MANSLTPSGSTANADRSSPAPDLTADANAVMDEAKSAAGKIADEAKDQVASLTDRAKDEVSAATDKVRSIAADQKDMLAEQVGGVAEAIDRVASDLEAGNGPSAHYARMIADNAQRLSTTIRENSVDDLLGIAQDFGRKQPALFMGAAAFLGFAASRFVVASAKRREEQATPAPNGYQEYAGEPASTDANMSANRSAGGA